jgi:hypothetical protein
VRPPVPELVELLDVFDPRIQELALAARGRVLERVPAANELIYDSYNALSLAYSSTGKLRGAFCHVALYTGHVNLGFNRGAELDDPDGLLRGAGAKIRHIRLEVMADLEQPHVAGFLDAAIALSLRGQDGVPGNAVQGRSMVMPTSGKKRRG